MTDDMTRAMFGCNAVHCGVNIIVQDGEDGRAIMVAQSKMTGPHPLRYGSKRTHILLLGDMVFRPQLVLGTDSFRGVGLNNLLRNGFMPSDEWNEGDIVLDPIGRFKEMERKH